MPAPTCGTEVRALGDGAVASHMPACNGSHRCHGGLTAGVRNFCAFGHVGIPRLVARGGLTSCPVRGSRLTAIGHEGT